MSRRPTLSIGLYLRGRRALLVGSDPAAAGRAERLRAAGADVVWVTTEEFRDDMCADAALVMAHTGDAATNERVVSAARAARCLTYAHDLPELSDFSMPALVAAPPVQIAISTQGAAPALARRLREQLEALVATGSNALEQLAHELEVMREATRSGSPRRAALYQVARRLRIRGSLEVEPPAGDNQT